MIVTEAGGGNMLKYHFATEIYVTRKKSMKCWRGFYARFCGSEDKKEAFFSGQKFGKGLQKILF